MQYRLCAWCGKVLPYKHRLQTATSTYTHHPENADLVDEWAIKLSRDTDPKAFAEKYGLYYAGLIPYTDIHVFRLGRGQPLSRTFTKATRQRMSLDSPKHQMFANLLARNAYKSQMSLEEATRLPRSIHATTSDDDELIWFEQQVATKRVKRQMVLPRDPLFSRQWHLTPADNHVSINAPEAWSLGMTGTGVNIAICDDGFDLDHPDIKDNYVWQGSYNFNKDNNDTRPNSLTEVHYTDLSLFHLSLHSPYTT